MLDNSFNKKIVVITMQTLMLKIGYFEKNYIMAIFLFYSCDHEDFVFSKFSLKYLKKKNVYLLEL